MFFIEFKIITLEHFDWSLFFEVMNAAQFTKWKIMGPWGFTYNRGEREQKALSLSR